MYGIYSKNNDGFIKQINNTKLENIKIDSIAFDTIKGEGIIYKGWNKNTVKSWTSKLYKKDFKADTNKYYDLLVQMDKEDVVIKHAHAHKTCGIASTSECIHRGISTHSNMIYDSITKMDEFETEGSIYLTEDIALENELVLTGDLYICLNGFNLSNVKINSNGYNINITNCQKTEADIIAHDENIYMFENTNLDILSGLGSINVKTNGLYNLNNDNKYNINLFNVNIATINETTNMSQIYVVQNENVNTKFVLSSVSIAGFSIDNNSFIHLDNVNMIMNDMNINSITDNDINDEFMSINGSSKVDIDNILISNNDIYNEFITINGSSKVAAYNMIIRDNNIINSDFINILSSTVIATINNAKFINNDINKNLIKSNSKISISELLGQDNIVNNNILDINNEANINNITLNANVIKDGDLIKVDNSLVLDDNINIINNKISKSILKTSELLSKTNLNIENNIYGEDENGYVIDITGDKFDISTTSIIRNKASNSYAIINSNGHLNANDNSIISIKNNEVNRKQNNKQILVDIKSNGINLSDYALIVITDNIVKTNNIKNNNILTVIDLRENQNINISSGSIVINNNKTDDMNNKNNNLLGIYSKNDKGFIKQNPNTKIDGRYVNIEKIAFETRDGSGIIYKNWNKNNVKNYTKTLYRDAFIADQIIKQVVRRMDGENVVIMPPHVHKTCGVSTESECSHRGINSVHTIATYSELIDVDTFPTKGAYYLAEDYQDADVVTLEGDLYLCLNGKSLTNVKFVNNDNYAVYITNCINENAMITSKENDYLFENTKNQIVSPYVVEVVTDGLAQINDDKLYNNNYYNIVLSPISTKSNIEQTIIDMNNRNAIKSKIVISSVSIARFNINNNNLINAKNTILNIYDTVINNNTINNSLINSEDIIFNIVDSDVTNNIINNNSLFVFNNQSSIVINDVDITSNKTGSSIFDMSDSNLYLSKTNIVENEFGQDKKPLIEVNNANIYISTGSTVVRENISTNAAYGLINIDGDLIVGENNKLEIKNNTIIRDNADQIFINAKNYILNNNSKFDIQNNKINCLSTTGDNKNNFAAVLFVGADKYINVATTSIIIKNNETVGINKNKPGNHLIGVYTNNDKGFIKQIGRGKILSTASFVENILFNNKTGEGIVYKNWDADKVTNYNSKLYKKLFTADTSKYIDLLVQMDKKDVVIKHAHAHTTCGVSTSSECKHQGIATHSIVRYDSLTAEDEFPVDGSYYLTENITNVGAITLEGDLNICLNGFDIEGIKFVDNNYKLTITNCGLNSKITNINQNDYLFDNTNVDVVTATSSIIIHTDALLNVTDDNKYNINMYSVVVSTISEMQNKALINFENQNDKNSKIVLSSTSIADRNVYYDKFINVMNAELAMFDVIIDNNIINNDSDVDMIYSNKNLLLNNVNITNNIVPGNIIKTTDIVEIINNVNIKQNISTASNADIINSESDIIIYDESELNIDKNKLYRAKDNNQAVLYSDGNIILNDKSKLNVTNNDLIVDNIKSNDKPVAAIIIPNDKYISLATSSIIVKNNKQVGRHSSNVNNHMFGIYSFNDDGFIRQQQNSKVYGNQLYMENIAFGNVTGLGIIYKNWTVDQVIDFDENLYKKVYSADKTLHSGINVMMKEDNVIIGNDHIHKICGLATNSECVHNGIATHSSIVYEEYIVTDDFPTEGAYYLPEDIKNISNIELTNDLYLCLNGYNISNINFISSEYNLYITNCSDKHNYMKANKDVYMFDDVNTYVLAGKGTIVFTTDGIFNINNKSNTAYMYNVIASRSNVDTTSNLSVIKVNNAAVKSDIVVSSVSIAEYDTNEDLISLNNNKTSIYSLNLYNNKTEKSIIKNNEQIDIYDEFNIYNNITKKNIINSDDILNIYCEFNVYDNKSEENIIYSVGNINMFDLVLNYLMK